MKITVNIKSERPHLDGEYELENRGSNLVWSRKGPPQEHLVTIEAEVFNNMEARQVPTSPKTPLSWGMGGLMFSGVIYMHDWVAIYDDAVYKKAMQAE